MITNVIDRNKAVAAGSLTQAYVFARWIYEERDRLAEAGQNQPSLLPTIRALTSIAKYVLKPCIVAIVGEANAGKSSLANRIAGTSTLPTMPIANTRVPTILRYADVPGIAILGPYGKSDIAASSERLLSDADYIEVRLPSPTLHGFEIIDYPPCNSRGSPISALDFMFRKADIAIWTTTATQAWRESERVAWSKLTSKFHGRGLLAVTHLDLLKTADGVMKLKCRLADSAASAFDDAVLLSLKDARQTGCDDLMRGLDRFRTLIDRERIEKAKRALARIATSTLRRLPG